MESHFNNINITKQNIYIKVNNDFSLKGYTELYCENIENDFSRVFFLNSRQLEIEKILIDNKEIEYIYINSHNSYNFEGEKLIRDADHFSTVSKIVQNSPELIINLEKKLNFIIKIYFFVPNISTALNIHNNILFIDNKICGSSSWFPCIDSYSYLIDFTLEITFLSDLLCIGPSKSESISTEEEGFRTLRFHLPYLNQSKSVGFVVGKLISFSLDQQFEITVYSSNDNENLRHSLNLIPKLFEEISEQIDEELIFENPLSLIYIPTIFEIISFPGIILLPTNIISFSGNINSSLIIIPKLIEAIYSQFVLFLLPVNSPNFEWIQEGLIKYLTDLKLSSKYGETTRHDRQWNDINYLMIEDIHENIVLNAIDPANNSSYKDEYLKIKAKLLMNMISSNINNNQNIESMFPILIQKSFNEFKKKPNFFNLKFFQYIRSYCPLISLSRFKEQWLESNGLPIFTFNLKHDSRNKVVKFVLSQSVSCKTKVNFFTGYIKAQLMDLDQVHEYNFPVENSMLSYQMKYFAAKVKGKNRTFEFENITEPFKTEISNSVLWITLDPSRSWIMKSRPKLPEFMILHQLDLLRDAFSLHQALSSLDDWFKSQSVLNKLKNILENEKIFYGIRCHAARCHGYFASETHEFDSNYKNNLLEWYKNLFCERNNNLYNFKNHNFENFPQHLVQLEVIKSLSIIRNSEGFTPEDLIIFFEKLIKESNNIGNIYNDDNFNSEVDLSLGRLNPKDINKLEFFCNEVISRLNVHSGIPSFRNLIKCSGFISSTSLIIRRIKNIQKTSIKDLIHNYNSLIDSMRKHLNDNTYQYESKSISFKCLLFLSYYKFGIKFYELISDLYNINNKITLSLCIKEIYKFLHNSSREGDKNKFESYLLCLPPSLNNNELINNLLKSKKSLQIAETLWDILTQKSKYNNLLRSETLRAYSSLFGNNIPKFYLEKKKNLPFELSITNNNKSILKIEVK